MTAPVSASPFENINRTIGVFKTFAKHDKTYRIAVKQILDLRDILHVRDNLGGITIQNKGKRVGQILLSLTEKTIQTLAQLSNQFFEKYSKAPNLTAVVKETIPQFLDQVKAYAEAEEGLGEEATWLRYCNPPAQVDDHTSLSVVAAVYSTLE